MAYPSTGLLQATRSRVRAQRGLFLRCVLVSYALWREGKIEERVSSETVGAPLFCLLFFYLLCAQ